MTATKSSITVAGRKVSILRAGPSSGEPILLVHGGRAGVSPIAHGSHIWGPVLPLLAAGRPVVAVDLPGAGGSDLGSPDGLMADKVCQHLLGVMDALSIDKAHFIGHDLGGYLGLWLAISAPARLRSLSILASPMAPPKGDGLDDITFLATPKPMWSRHSQTWAFERLSYGQGHIDDALIDACVEAAQGKPHLDAVAALQDEQLRLRDFGIPGLKGKIWAALRGDGMSVPSQLVWSSHDPLAARDAGYVLFQIMAKKQKATYFHLINRAGSFAFREQPKEFAQVVMSFLDSVDARLAA
jgi:2-hydroxy-6-oxonona-2,4-dienedioate hydrolase